MTHQEYLLMTLQQQYKVPYSNNIKCGLPGMTLDIKLRWEEHTLTIAFLLSTIRFVSFLLIIIRVVYKVRFSISKFKWPYPAQLKFIIQNIQRQIFTNKKQVSWFRLPRILEYWKQWSHQIRYWHRLCCRNVWKCDSW